MNESALRNWEEKASGLVAQCVRIEEEGLLVPGSPWSEKFQEVKKAAYAVLERARSPVKIGVVGEFSAGKSLLLGSLIGYADYLPISELPTTGNVTALNFTPVDSLTSTELGQYRIHFLDHDGFYQCLQFMLTDALKRAKQAELPANLCEGLAEIKATDESLQSIAVWCKQAWTATQNPSLRFLIRELIIFIRAYKHAAVGLCDRREPFEVSADVAKQGLELQVVEQSIQAMTFGELPTPVKTISARPEHLTPELIRLGFPLIRLVSVNVRVSQHIWNLANLSGDNRFVLLDFPGLGADSSGVRDLFLCLRELEQIQTILILLNGKKPGGDQGSKLYDLLQRHRSGQDIRDMILVAIGRFDQLPLKQDEESKLQEFSEVNSATPTLVKTSGTDKKGAKSRKWDDDDDAEDVPVLPKSSGSPSAALDEKMLWRELPILNSCLKGAQALVPEEKQHRIVLVSPLFHLKYLEDKNAGIQVGSESFMAKERGHAERAMDQAKGWAGIASRLEKASTAVTSKNLLPAWLRNYAIDGGISRLRQLIESHVQEHGLKQLEKDVARDVKSLRDHLQQWKALIPSAVAKDNRVMEDKIHAAEQDLRQLVVDWREAIHGLKRNLRFTIRVSGANVYADELLLQEIVLNVCEWPEWDYLFHQRKDGYIEEPVKKKSRFDLDDDVGDTEEEGAARGFPTKSEDFLDPFARSVEHLEKYTRKLVEDGFQEWLNGLGEKCKSLQQTFGQAVQRRTLKRELSLLRLGPRGENLAGILRAAVEPARLRKILFEGDIVSQDQLRLDPTKLFPLARTSKESGGRVFAWSRVLLDSPADLRPSDSSRHQSMILRLRDQFISVLRQEMSQLLSLSMACIVEELNNMEAEMLNRISFTANNPFIIETILRDGDQAAQAESPAEDSLSVVQTAANFSL